MSDSLIPSFLMSHVSKSLRSLTKNELCERIAQVAHQKWATWVSLTKNDWMSESLVFWSKSLIRSFFHKKRAIYSENDERIPSPAIPSLFEDMVKIPSSVSFPLSLTEYLKKNLKIQFRDMRQRLTWQAFFDTLKYKILFVHPWSPNGMSTPY